MTRTQAIELQDKWKALSGNPPCYHRWLELEEEANYWATDYQCIVCGESVARKPNVRKDN
jgi:hypothetical protein